jgi:hypothetical protein
MAIVDWRDVPTYSEFEILRDAFTAQGVPTIICDPRDLEYVASASSRPGSPAPGLYAGGRRIDLVYRRVLINDMIAREDDCRTLVDAYESRTVCVANSLRCKIPHKKAFFAVLTDERRAALFSPEERELIHRHIPWTVLVPMDGVARGRSIDFPHLRVNRLSSSNPTTRWGHGVTLGWKRASRNGKALARRVRAGRRGWRRNGLPRREIFPSATAGPSRCVHADDSRRMSSAAAAGVLTGSARPVWRT